MIVGRLVDVDKQQKVLPAAIVRAIRILQQAGIERLETGRHEIDGDQLFYTVEDVVLRTFAESRVEAHACYADIQMPLSAVERYGFSLPQDGLLASDDQLAARDLAFFPSPSNETFFALHPGSFVVFLPGELHRPCLVVDENVTLRKVVVKVHRRLLGL